MSVKSDGPRRCAIYTRKSTEHGLELEFNSLDAQREACEAYIKSQASQGWRSLPQPYDDPAYSGGNLDRPALRQLLKDIDAGLIDTVVVYKIDRLTRSLADFAKLVELFDARSISFVAVTQQFNTTTSMGRLTLNILLSFAQFERELSSERVRDKVAASRRKGIWTGGSVPLGYDSKDKKLVVNQAEAETVRMIFERYLALKSFSQLLEELDHKSIVSKKRDIDQSKMASAVRFTYGPLAYLLKNRTYLGESGHKGSWFPGEHKQVVDADVFERVQELLETNSVKRIRERHETPAVLLGVLFDDRGNRMTSTFATKRGVRYQYYISSALLRGRKQEAGSVTRVSAPDIEKAVIEAVRVRLDRKDDGCDVPPHDFVTDTIERVVVHDRKIEVTLKSAEIGPAPTLQIPWTGASISNRAAIEGADAATAPAPNPQLLQAVVRAHVWVRMLTDGTHDSIEGLATAIDLHPKIVRNQIRMAFLAPDILEAVLRGEQPPEMRLAHFKFALPFWWPQQIKTLRRE